MVLIEIITLNFSLYYPRHFSVKIELLFAMKIADSRFEVPAFEVRCVWLEARIVAVCWVTVVRRIVEMSNKLIASKSHRTPLESGLPYLLLKM